MAFVSKIFSNTLATQNEKYLMDGDKLRRLIDSDYESALRALRDYGWGEGLTDNVTADSLLAAETAKLISFVRENSIDDRVERVLLASFMFHNAKAAYKGRLTGADVSRALYGGFDDVAKAVTEKEYAELPDILADCLTALDEKAETTSLTPREIDMSITRAIYEYSLAAAKGDRTLKKYVTSEIDLKNLLTLFRCRMTGLSAGALESMFIEGGGVNLFDATRALEGNEEYFSQYFARSDYSEIFENVGKGADAVTEIETGIDNYLYALTLAGRENFLSRSPFINYFHRAMLELKTVKTVLVCIKNGAVGEIKRRLRAIYD